MPYFSVVIPVYNRAAMLEVALESALQQTYDDYEIIVVDDGSEDDLQNIVGRLGSPKIRFIRHERNLGGGKARNTGIDAATGQFVAFLDSDDRWQSDKLELQRKTIEEEKADLAFTDFHGRQKNYYYNREDTPYRKLLLENYIGTASTVVANRGLLQRIGGFDEDLPSCQDWDTWIRLAKVGKTAYVSKKLVEYLPSEDSITQNIEAVIRGHEIVLQKHFDDIASLGSEALSCHYLRLGRFCCHAGEMNKGKNYLSQAFHANPSDPKVIAHLLLSQFGETAYRQAVTYKRKVL